MTDEENHRATFSGLFLDDDPLDEHHHLAALRELLSPGCDHHQESNASAKGLLGILDSVTRTDSDGGDHQSDDDSAPSIDAPRAAPPSSPPAIADGAAAARWFFEKAHDGNAHAQFRMGRIQEQEDWAQVGTELLSWLDCLPLTSHRPR